MSKDKLPANNRPAADKDRDHSHKAHAKLRESIRRRDGKGLAKAIRIHLQEARDDLFQTLTAEEIGTAEPKRGEPDHTLI